MTINIGIVFPQYEMGTDIHLARDFFQTADELGYDYVLAYDHVLGANPDRPDGWDGPYIHTHLFHEVFTFFSYMAAITENIQFVTGILISPQRQTALIAKQAAELDFLSNGRVRLGIGIGWNAVEYEALNEDFSNRGVRSAEQVEVMRQLWTHELVTFKGDYHTIADAGLNPMPVQRPIPVWFGGRADAVLKRMAKLGDGWMPGGTPREGLAPHWETLKQYLAKEGRDATDFGLDVWMMNSRLEQKQWANEVQAWADFGATHAAFNTLGSGLQGAEHIQVMRDFMETVRG